ncbi:hypothetical protein EJ03DRAFT_173570 [Teratosphaeria nubilosa]|uniref:Uncharacterized protein n=1 Tax=Teratosphaeria nubilosa TaxID=161662 RepID=A0A6G1L1F4_9PEZI|nr:hypothetical protein EJ03DRAFT_173570 [Teratosphaeria nubilosa]
MTTNMPFLAISRPWGWIGARRLGWARGRVVVVEEEGWGRGWWLVFMVVGVGWWMSMSVRV